MKLLLDAHALLWWLGDDKRLGAAAREAVADPSSVVLVGAATIWEIEIKARLGRIALKDVDLVEQLGIEGFVGLAVSARHAQHAARLPGHHGDPFDRMLVAQAILEDLTCVSKDAMLGAYGVRILW